MKTKLAVAAAAALTLAAAQPAHAGKLFGGPVPVAVQVTAWWVGLGGASLMTRALLTSAHQNRPLVAQEANEAFFLPFLWVVTPPVVAAEPAPRARKRR